MPTTDTTTDTVVDTVAAARQAAEAGIEELRLQREADAKAEAEEQRAAAARAQRRAELEAQFAQAEAERRHAERVSAAIEAFETAQVQYRTAAEDADTKCAAVTELSRRIADATAAAVPAELARLQVGEALKAAHRALDGLVPGHANAPTVPGKRLLTTDREGAVAGVQKIAETLHPDLKAGLDRLKRFEPWKPPSYAYIQGRRVLQP